MPKSSAIFTVLHHISHENGMCNVAVRDEDGKEIAISAACGVEGWFPDKHDVVRVVTTPQGVMIEPVGWKSEEKDEDKVAAIIERKRLKKEAHEAEKVRVAEENDRKNAESKKNAKAWKQKQKAAGVIEAEVVE